MQEDPDKVVDVLVGSLQPVLEIPRKLTPNQATLELRKAYLQRYNLATQGELERDPSVIVRMNQAEDPWYGTVMEERMEEFLDLHVHEHFGTTWEQFLDKPRVECDLMISVLKRWLKKNSGETDTEKDLKKALKQLMSNKG